MIPLHETVAEEIRNWLSHDGRPLVVGLSGAQGSGKSTLAAKIAAYLARHAIATRVLSLDDLYLAPERRPVDVHPLFATRGVPGTHDVGLGIQVIDAGASRRPCAWPRFDKANDRPFPRDAWSVMEFPADIILLEGWCTGAVPQPEADLAEAVNDLERDRDPDGVWRRHVNAQLAGPYAELFGRINRLILLRAPGFDVVQAWRTEQEHDLSRMLEREGRSGEKVMSDAQVAHFVQHYERLTRYILDEMPGRADMTIRLGADRTPL